MRDFAYGSGVGDCGGLCGNAGGGTGVRAGEPFLCGEHFAVSGASVRQDQDTDYQPAIEAGMAQQLAEIDSVFVTLESHQGTRKPLGGKILFAFLGGQANHP